jgi:methylmalonyl-CoA/ethylmalonyl-CoA epimerase
MLKDISHVAIAVTNLDRACAFYHDVMGGEIVNRHVIGEQKVEVAFIKFGGRTKIELLCPTEAESPVGRFLARHGPGLHHVCFETDSIENEMVSLEDHGVKMVDKTPRTGAEHDRIAFAHPTSTLGTLIEISESIKPL